MALVFNRTKNRKSSKINIPISSIVQQTTEFIILIVAIVHLVDQRNVRSDSFRQRRNEEGYATMQQC